MTEQNSVALVVLALLIFGSLGCALLIGMLSHYRAGQNTRAQGATRALIFLYFIAVAAGAFGVAHDWPVEARVTPIAVIAYLGMGALIIDIRDEIRKDPHWGPLWRAWVVWQWLRVRWMRARRKLRR